MPKITVGCKLPQGLIIEMGYTPVPGGTVRGNDYKAVRLRGANMYHGAGGTAPANLKAGLTHNVDEAFFDAWVASHADLNIVKNKLVFKASSKAEGEAKALDTAQQKTGMEPLDSSKAPGGIQKASFDDEK